MWIISFEEHTTDTLIYVRLHDLDEQYAEQGSTIYI